MTSLLALCVLSFQSPPDQCLAFISHNLARGNSNFYTYMRFSSQKVTLKADDVLVYSIFLDPKNPVAKGGLDIDFADGGEPLRDLDVRDDAGRRAHGDTVLEGAKGKWLTRRIPLAQAAGRETSSWCVNFEGDAFGRYVEFVDDVFIQHADGSKTAVYETGNPPLRVLEINEGYSSRPVLMAIERSKVIEGMNIDPLVAEVDRLGEQQATLAKARTDLDQAKQFLAQNPDAHLDGHIKEAEAALAEIENRLATPQEIEAVLHTVNHALQHTHPVMEKYTGHLVGHAHIDLQWLWEWQEGIVFSRDTFAQAAKFMEEYPGFTFSQSSSCLYQAMEEHYPEVFKKIQEKVKKGQWEIVGGRVCEADTNMISPESHARHFLYGQRYFREKFGKTAKVGWEPDTFGHTIQMPQILKLGGCDSYYFCRGGKGKPLFWWQALDGTKILSFDEPASGSWYNSDLSYKQFQEMIDFKAKTGSKDSLMVYGVGNHGGGPTREHIEEALSWMKDPNKPKVRFSTATEFFNKLRTYDLTVIPVIDQELNPVFDGCYTSHAEIKRANRDAEAWTTTAEAVATGASFFGFKYPRASFRRNWEDICFNHHHDTLPGSGIHAPYDRTTIQLNRVIADDKDIVTRALEQIVINVKVEPRGMSVLVFNPLGWKRDAWVQLSMVKSGWDGGDRFNIASAIADSEKDVSPVELVDGPSRVGRFLARDLPSFGYRVYHLYDGAKKPERLQVKVDGFQAETEKLKVSFDSRVGAIDSLEFRGRQIVAPGGKLGLPVIDWENPGGMSAWTLGKIDKEEPAKLVGFEESKEGSDALFAFQYRLAPTSPGIRPTTFSQTFRISPYSEEIVVDVDCDWHAVGGGNRPAPMLRARFDTPFNVPAAHYEVPFGSIERSQDGKEYPALKWADVENGAAGLAVLNDSKYGYSCEKGTMRLSLIRSSFDPDPVPNPGHHHWRYSIVPHAGSWQAAAIPQKAAEFNQPVVWATVPFDANGKNPREWSALQFQGVAIPTALKLAEDDDSLVVRFYDWMGGTKPALNTMTFNAPVKLANLVNFVEDKLGTAKFEENMVVTTLRPWEIQTVKVNLARDAGPRQR